MPRLETHLADARITGHRVRRTEAVPRAGLEPATQRLHGGSRRGKVSSPVSLCLHLGPRRAKSQVPGTGQELMCTSLISWLATLPSPCAWTSQPPNPPCKCRHRTCGSLPGRRSCQCRGRPTRTGAARERAIWPLVSEPAAIWHLRGLLQALPHFYRVLENRAGREATKRHVCI